MLSTGPALSWCPLHRVCLTLRKKTEGQLFFISLQKMGRGKTGNVATPSFCHDLPVTEVAFAGLGLWEGLEHLVSLSHYLLPAMCLVPNPNLCPCRHDHEGPPCWLSLGVQ